MTQNKDLLYVAGHNNFFDKIISSKRIEIVKIINDIIKNYDVEDALDIGSTEDENNKSSNIIIKNLNKVKVFKSISDQKINSSFFSKVMKKSITEELSDNEIKNFKSDIVISSAVIEHVGNTSNQKKMIKNIQKLSKKLFIITTPNRGYPLDFHTKLPFIHWLPKRMHRKILKFLGMNFFSEEKNLNLLSKKNIKDFLESLNIKYEIINIKLLGITSNFIVIGKIEN